MLLSEHSLERREVSGEGHPIKPISLWRKLSHTRRPGLVSSLPSRCTEQLHVPARHFPRGVWRMSHVAWCMSHGAWRMVHDASCVMQGKEIPTLRWCGDAALRGSPRTSVHVHGRAREKTRHKHGHEAQDLHDVYRVALHVGPSEYVFLYSTLNRNKLYVWIDLC